jgi:hypothetical protein
VEQKQYASIVASEDDGFREELNPSYLLQDWFSKFQPLP